jgi:transposase InsO family protein
VEDLAARYRARWGPACYPLTMVSASGDWSCAAEQVLEALIAQHGAPLVLKADNGSAFIAKRFASFCRSHGIALVHSPVRRPQCNGCCEVGGKHA